MVGCYTSAAMGTDGLALISYRDASNADLKVRRCLDVSCTSASLTTLDDGAANVGQYTS